MKKLLYILTALVILLPCTVVAEQRLPAANFQNKIIRQAHIRDYVTVCADPGSTVTPDFDMNTANCWTDTIDTGATTFTFSNAPTGGLGNLSLKLINGGSQTITWPANVQWPGSVEPILTASGTDWIECVTDDAGTTYFCFIAGLDFG